VESTRLRLSPLHPSTHGTLQLALQVDGDRIVACDPEVGFLHRGVEKLFEVRDYRQLLMLSNRHDWLAAFANELGAALVVERMLGIEPPPRAVWIRTLMAELNRVTSHLAFVVEAADEEIRPAPLARALREPLLALMEEATGGRMHFMFNQVGGLRDDLPAGWREHCRSEVAKVRAGLPGLAERVLSSDFRERTRGLGVLTADMVRSHGVSGPAARASGVDLDLRRDDPYLAYRELADSLHVVTRSEGDVLARFEVLLDQVKVSLGLADACLDRLEELPSGAVNVRLPKVLKVPEGSSYHWTEAPSGITGYFLVSTGDKVPWRMKVRSPSFGNVSALRDLAPGTRVGDLELLLASLFYVIGDIDR
jgi:NADH-quinone oxidoreductase subunit D